MKFEAAIHGAKPKKKSLTELQGTLEKYNGDPGSCNDMTQDAKDKLTRELMEEHSKMFSPKKL